MHHVYMSALQAILDFKRLSTGKNPRVRPLNAIINLSYNVSLGGFYMHDTTITMIN